MIQIENKSKELLELCLDLLKLMDEESKKTYKLIQTFLAEESHSFGFKPLFEIRGELVKNLDDKLFKDNNELIQYSDTEFDPVAHTKEKEYDLSKKEILLEYIYNETDFLQEDRTKELFLILVDIQELLYKKGKETEKILLELLNEESYAFGVKPIETIISHIEKKIDKEYFKEYYSIMEWYCYENEFGKTPSKFELDIETNEEKLLAKELELDIDEEKYIYIKNKKDLWNYMLYFRNFIFEEA